MGKVLFWRDRVARVTPFEWEVMEERKWDSGMSNEGRLGVMAEGMPPGTERRRDR